MPNSEKGEVMRLGTLEELVQANEWLFNKQRNGEIDSKLADGMNTTLKNSIYLNVKLRLDAFKLVLQAHIKKVPIPKGILPIPELNA